MVGGQVRLCIGGRLRAFGFRRRFISLWLGGGLASLARSTLLSSCLSLGVWRCFCVWRARSCTSRSSTRLKGRTVVSRIGGNSLSVPHADLGLSSRTTTRRCPRLSPPPQAAAGTPKPPRRGSARSISFCNCRCASLTLLRSSWRTRRLRARFF